MILQLGDLERLLILEKDVVILPELALLVGAHPALGGLGCVLVEVEREVAEDEPDFTGVALHHLLDGVVCLAAEGALEIRELHQRYPRILRTPGRTFRLYLLA